jgi:hypothetical protein
VNRKIQFGNRKVREPQNQKTVRSENGAIRARLARGAKRGAKSESGFNLSLQPELSAVLEEWQ